MKTMMMLMTICGWLVAMGSAGGVIATETKVFNVVAYGAVADDKSDNTAAFSACLDALIKAGGGQMFLPDGVYRGRIIIPPVSKPLPSWITPLSNNAALTLLRNVAVTGYHNGILVHEHTDADNINLCSNINALNFASAHHASRFGRVCAQRNTHNVTVSGKHGFVIEQLDTEFPGPGQTDAKNA